MPEVSTQDVLPDRSPVAQSTAPSADWIRRAIALLQVLGGAQGLLFSVPITFSPGFIIGAPFLTIYVLSIAAGIGLWRGTPGGERRSILVQVLQIPWFTTPHFAYSLSCGAGLWAGIGSAGWQARRVLASTFHIELHFGDLPATATSGWVFGVNYLALIALIYLLATRRRQTATTARWSSSLLRL